MSIIRHAPFIKHVIDTPLMLYHVRKGKTNITVIKLIKFIIKSDFLFFTPPFKPSLTVVI